jgi:hypothetical protein
MIKIGQFKNREDAMLGRRSGLGWLAVVALMTLWAQPASLAQDVHPNGPPHLPEIEVALVRQDFSDCTNSNVSANNPSLIGGTVWLIRNTDGNTAVKVGITASPNTTYHFFLKCVRQLGDVITQDEGEGLATFSFPTNAVGSVYAFDVYPEGAPAGNKFQSVQVKFE